MGIKVRGIQASKQGLDALVNDIQGRRAPRAVQSASIIIGSEAAVLTPIDTSTLINSQFRELMVNGTMVTGRVGYSADYAVYVHNAPGKLKGKPRSGVQSFNTSSGKVAFASDKGNFWDPHAEPHFLTKGAANAKDAVIAVVHKEMSR
ncbi:hypothetical protein [Tatumella citrea]|uniref:HK97 gp10 family phage protein n=1 Tax=Tatumella citrea TaxID=53336 RepID=A0A1Y0L926_TATCI|nr:hypothetical protein [Tatumella citrea]ARU94561.1 hypothetical protein A7K98_12790 [Tatumella citrea]ARU98599.1 hypothetical protein A7K99_12780 [Tatumella citrea]